MKYWLLNLVCVYQIHAMDISIEMSSDKIKVPENKIAKLAIGLHFSDSKCTIIKDIKKKLTDRLRKLTNSDSEDSEQESNYTKQLLKIAQESNRSLKSKIKRISSNKQLKEFLDNMVIESVHEFCKEKDQATIQLQRRVSKEQSQKSGAILSTIITFILGTISTLVAYYTN